ncbi:uroporphyrinogen decarboxylase family protein [Chloroflexota bacterium]
MMTNRERFFAAMNGEEADRVPLFPLLMFLAVDRAGISYRQYAMDGQALTEAQLLVQERYDLDAITVCSDAFPVSADLGGDIVHLEDNPPYLRRPLITSTSDLERLRRPDPLARDGRMGDRVRAAAAMARAVSGEVATLGWIDMPLAEACSVCSVSEFMMLLMDDPAGAHRILTFLTEIVIDFALAQVEAGVDMIGAGDAVAFLVSAATYEEFALPYERQVCQAIHDAGSLVKLHICGDTTHLLDKTVESGADLFNVDHMVPLVRARDAYGARGKCFKGNLDPVAHVMQASSAQCEAMAHECIDVAWGTNYMLSAGCEIPAETPDEVFRAFCDAPRTYRSSAS